MLSKHSNKVPTILIGRDTRISGTLIESAMTAGFLSYGANVKQLGVIPTPGVAYLTKRYKAVVGQLSGRAAKHDVGYCGKQPDT